jgi:hypothetical protein
MATDLEKARRIAQSRRFYVGAGGALRENVARSIAEGIAVGRKEGLERAAEIIKAELAKLATKSN